MEADEGTDSLEAATANDAAHGPVVAVGKGPDRHLKMKTEGKTCTIATGPHTRNWKDPDPELFPGPSHVEPKT